MAKNIPILYSFVRCPYAIRARMALVEAGINCIVREVNLRDKPPHLLEISPKATVPVLLFSDGEIIEESIEILHFAEANSQFKHMGSRSEEIKESMNDIISANDTEFVSLSRIYKYPDRYTDQSPYESRDKICKKFLDKYEQMLEAGGYLFGDKSIADIAILPFVRQFAKVDEDWFFNSKYSNVIRWVRSFADADYFQNIIMVKNKIWEESDEPIYLLNS